MSHFIDLLRIKRGKNLVEFDVAGNSYSFGKGADFSHAQPVFFGLHQKEGDAFYISLKKESQ